MIKRYFIHRVMFFVLLLCNITCLKAQEKDSLQHYNFFFLEGICQEQKGYQSAAFDMFSRALELNPKAAEVYYKLASYYFQLKDTITTRKYLAKAAKTDPQNDTFQERLAQVCTAQKDYDDAINAYERLYAINKTRIDVLQALLQLYAQKDNKKMMIDVLNRLELVNGTSEQLSLSKMQIYEEMGDKNKEYEELKKLVDNHPLELNYKVMLGNWFFNKGKRKEALAIYKAVLKEDPQQTAAKLSLVDYYNSIKDNNNAEALVEDILLSQKTDTDIKMAVLRQYINIYQTSNTKDSKKIFHLFDKALTPPQSSADIYMLKAAFMDIIKMPNDSIDNIYQKVLQIEPDNVPARINLIYNIWNKHHFDKVIELCKAAQLYNPTEMVFYYFQGYALYQKHQNDSIDNIYQKVLQIEPDNVPARINLIYNIWNKHHFDKVIELCKAAQLYNPTEMVFYYFQGYALYQKHQNDEALEAFKKGVTQIKPDSKPDIVSDFYAIMGDILYEKGLTTEAFNAYDSCLSWKPDNYPALNNYAFYLSQTGKNLSKAESMSYKTIKAEPKNGIYLDTYAWILFKLKRYEEAKIYIEQAMRNYTKQDKTVLEHAGDIYSMTGNTDKAIEFWKKSLEEGNNNDILKQKLQTRKYIAK